MGKSVLSGIDSFFGISNRGSNFRTEIIAGITTFLSMCYIIIINPTIMMAAGIPFGDAVWATVITIFVCTMLMGIYTNRPYVVAPLVSQNTLVIYVLCGLLHYPWRSVLGASFLAGILFTLFFLSGIWEIVIQSIPDTITRSCTRSIGFFIAFLGTSNSGIVILGGMTIATPFLRDIQPYNLLSLLIGITIIGVLMIRGTRGALMGGILTSALFAYILGIETLPPSICTLPPEFPGFIFHPDIGSVLSPVMLPVIALFFLLTFFDSIATIFGLSMLTQKEGEQTENENNRRSFLATGYSMMIGSALGCTPSSIYIESVAGVREGGRTGLVSVVVVIFTICSLFFLPLIESFPDVATAAALLVIGLLMLAQFRLQSLSSREELLTAFVLMVTMTITQNIGLGLSMGIITYPIFMFAAEKHRDIPRVFWSLVLCAAIFLIFFPY